MCWESVPYEDDFLPPQASLEVFQEADQAVRVVAALARLKAEATAATVPAIARGGTDGYLRPVESMDQGRRFAFGCPCAVDRGSLRDAAFVLEEDPRPLSASFFFTSGQRCSSQSLTFSGFRSRACLAGRCRVQSIVPRIFHI